MVERSLKEILESIHENIIGIMESDFTPESEMKHLQEIDEDIRQQLQVEVLRDATYQTILALCQ